MVGRILQPFQHLLWLRAKLLPELPQRLAHLWQQHVLEPCQL